MFGGWFFGFGLINRYFSKPAGRFENKKNQNGLQMPFFDIIFLKNKFAFFDFSIKKLHKIPYRILILLPLTIKISIKVIVCNI